MDGTALTDDVGFLLTRASGQLVRTTNAALAEHGLRVRSYSALLLASDSRGGISQRDLAESLGLDPSQVVLLVDELADSGLVERRASATDRRTKLVAATDSGRHVRDRAQQSVAAAHTAGLAALTVDEQDQLRGLLGRLLLGAGVSD